MSSLQDYLLGQIMQTVQSVQSEQRETNSKLDKMTDTLDSRMTELEEQIEEKRTWEQRVVWIIVAGAASVFLNWSPERVGEVLAQFLRGIK